MGLIFMLDDRQKGKYMKDSFILKDGTTIKLEASASISGLTTVFANWAEAASFLPKLTEENLTSVQVQNGEGLTVGNYTNLVLQPGSWEVKEDGVYVTISLREKTEFEKRMDKVESGQEVQDGAIAELAGKQGGVQ